MTLHAIAMELRFTPAEVRAKFPAARTAPAIGTIASFSMTWTATGQYYSVKISQYGDKAKYSSLTYQKISEYYSIAAGVKNGSIAVPVVIIGSFDEAKAIPMIEMNRRIFVKPNFILI